MVAHTPSVPVLLHVPEGFSPPLRKPWPGRAEGMGAWTPDASPRSIVYAGKLVPALGVGPSPCPSPGLMQFIRLLVRPQTSPGKITGGTSAYKAAPKGGTFAPARKWYRRRGSNPLMPWLKARGLDASSSTVKRGDGRCRSATGQRQPRRLPTARPLGFSPALIRCAGTPRRLCPAAPCQPSSPQLEHPEGLEPPIRGSAGLRLCRLATGAKTYFGSTPNHQPRGLVMNHSPAKKARR